MIGYDAIVRQYTDYRYSPKDNSANATYGISSSGEVSIMSHVPLLERIAQIKDRFLERRNSNPIRELSRYQQGLIKQGAFHLRKLSKLEKWVQDDSNNNDIMALKLYHEVEYLSYKTAFENTE